MFGDDDDDEVSEVELLFLFFLRLLNFEDIIKRIEFFENVFQFDKVEKLEEKLKKGGFKMFKKKYRRQLLDGNVVGKVKNDSEKGDVFFGVGEKNKFYYRRLKL